MNKLYVLILLLCISCSNRQKEVAVSIENETDSIQSEVLEQASEPFFQIDLFKEMKKAQKGQLKLSDFFQSIEYVPLETKSESLIGGGRHGIENYLVTEKVIVADMKIFDRKDGHYIGDLLSQGQGPQEYTHAMGVTADDECEEFYIYDISKMTVHVVGYDNTHKGLIGVGDYAGVQTLYNGNLLIPHQNTGYNKRRDVFYIVNKDSKKKVYEQISPKIKGIQLLEDLINCERIGYLENKDKIKTYFSVRGSIFNKIWQYDKKVRYYDTLTDTVYSLSSDFKICPIGYIDTEKLRMTQEEYETPHKKRYFNVYELNSIREFSKGFLIDLVIRKNASKESEYYTLFYSKNNHNVQTVYRKSDEKIQLFKNDLDQGFDFSPSYSWKSGMYRFLSAEKIKEYIAKKGAAFFTTKEGKAFKAMGDKLKYDDNEVVVILKWK